MKRPYSFHNFFSIAIFVLSPFIILSQSLKFDHLKLEDGLKSASIQCIFQDSKGFVWIGTQNELHRYDGFNLQLFGNSSVEKFPNSAPLYRTSDIIESSEGTLYFATLIDGLVRLKPDRKKFEVFKFDENQPKLQARNELLRIIFSKDEKYIWAITHGGGLLKIKIYADSLESQYIFPKKINSPDRHLFNIKKDKEENIWVITKLGKIFKLNTQGELIESIPGLPLAQNNCVSGSMFIDKQNILWFGINEYLYKVDLNIKKGSSHIFEKVKNLGNCITDIIEDEDQHLWVGTREELFILTPITRSIKHVCKNRPDQPKSLGGGTERIYEDKTGNIWIGLQNSGLSMYTKWRNKNFNTLEFDPPYPENSLVYKNVRSFEKDHDGNIWIGTSKGLSRIELNLGQPSFTNFYHIDSLKKPLNILKGEYIRDLYFVNSDELLIANEIGIEKLDIKENKILDIIPINEEATYVTKIDNAYLVGTYGAGLAYIPNPESKTVIYSDSIFSYKFENIWHIRIDSENIIWLAAGLHGIIKLKHNPQKKSLEFIDYQILKHPKHSGISSTRMTYEDSQKRIWVTTTNGIYLFEKKHKASLKFLDSENGLPDNKIYCVQEDKMGDFWISSNFGVSRLTIDESSDSLISVLSFDKKDGLQDYEFNTNSFFQDQDGLFYFGGLNGANYFNPLSVTTDSSISKPSITKVKLAKRSLEENILASLNKEKPIILNYNESRVITFEFTALHYSAPERNQYNFYLEGVDKPWVFFDKSRTRSYTNLKEGTYTFKVKVSNSSGIWNEIPDEFKFRINPPWWRSWLAYSFYIIGFSGIIYLLYIYYSNIKLGELSQFKDELFIMNVHDLRFSLNSIIQKAEELLNQNSNLTKPLLQEISDRGNNMNMQLESILDLERVESNNLNLFLGEYSWNETINEAIKIVEGFLKDKNITIEKPIKTNLIGNFDKNYIVRVLVNLLTNAIKYSPSNSIIKITANNNGENLTISITDTGEGIPIKMQPYIFDRQKQIKAKELKRVKSTGLGLAFCKLIVELHGGSIQVKSNLGKETTFSFTLKENIVTEEKIEIKNPKSKNNFIKLTPEEKIKLNSYLEKILNIPFYKWSEIGIELNSLEFNPSNKNLNHFLNELKVAWKNFNEKDFSNLIKMIKK